MEVPVPAAGPAYADEETIHMDLVGLSAIDIARVVRDGEASAVEVVRAHLDHLAEVEHRLGAFVSVRRRSALEDAEAVDARADRFDLPLAGVPVAVKDAIDVAGEPTRHGSQATSSAPVDTDDVAVQRLKAAGAIVLGKTRCPELGLWGTSDDPAGTAVSPWDPSRTAGGSSGGSGAAVGAGVVPVALASDGLGSIRIPAAACGTFGLKPGGDRVPETVGGEPHLYGMARLGPIATTVADGALVLDVISGTDDLRDVAALEGRVRVAVSFRPPTPGIAITSAWREAAIEAGRLLNHAGHIVERDDPPYEQATVQAVLARWTQGAVHTVERLGLDRELLQPRTRGQIARGEQLARIRPVREEDAQRWKDHVEPFFDDHDVLITPAFARTQPSATAWHTKPWVSNVAVNMSTYPFLAAWNLADLPAAVVPLWHDGGRPLAVQVVGARGREDLVLSVAAQLEALVPWTRHAPGWGVTRPS
ncbi:MAG: amidase family protein [Nitriliruptoraceae bacterium]